MNLKEQGQLQELINRMEIDKLLNDYMRGQDRLDAALPDLSFGMTRPLITGFIKVAQTALSNMPRAH